MNDAIYICILYSQNIDITNIYFNMIRNHGLYHNYIQCMISAVDYLVCLGYITNIGTLVDVVMTCAWQWWRLNTAPTHHPMYHVPCAATKGLPDYLQSHTTVSRHPFHLFLWEIMGRLVCVHVVEVVWDIDKWAMLIVCFNLCLQACKHKPSQKTFCTTGRFISAYKHTRSLLAFQIYLVEKLPKCVCHRMLAILVQQLPQFVCRVPTFLMTQNSMYFPGYFHVKSNEIPRQISLWITVFVFLM